MRKSLVLITLFLSITLINSQEQTPSPILFIYDASGSMWGQLDGKTKKDIASEVLSTSISKLPTNQNIGLMAYGHRNKSDCRDVEFLVDISNSSKALPIKALKDINPLGKTPLAYSAMLAINSLKESKTKATIILITDGIESCDGDVCKVIADAKAAGIDFKLHIVGFGLKEGETEQLKCAAKMGGGNYYDASNAGGLGDVLTEATAQTVDDPKPNFSVYAVKNGQPLDAWFKPFKAETQEALNAVRSYRDTAFIYLPPGKYVLEVKPLENTDINAIMLPIESVNGQMGHQTVSFDSGKINVTTLNNGEGWDATVKVLKAGTKKSISGVRTYGRAQDLEINPGMYDVLIQALKIEGIETNFKIENIEVKANETSTIRYNFKSGIALIGVKTSGGELIDSTVNFFEKTTGKNVAAARTYTSNTSNPKPFILNPGTYDVKVVTLGKHSGHSETFSIIVKEGETVEKQIQY